MSNEGYLDRDAFAAVVIGSGFGGAVAACRLAQAGLTAEGLTLEQERGQSLGCV